MKIRITNLIAALDDNRPLEEFVAELLLKVTNGNVAISLDSLKKSSTMLRRL